MCLNRSVLNRSVFKIDANATKSQTLAFYKSQRFSATKVPPRRAWFRSIPGPFGSVSVHFGSVSGAFRVCFGWGRGGVGERGFCKGSCADCPGFPVPGAGDAPPPELHPGASERAHGLAFAFMTLQAPLQKRDAQHMFLEQKGGTHRELRVGQNIRFFEILFAARIGKLVRFAESPGRHSRLNHRVVLDF